MDKKYDLFCDFDGTAVNSIKKLVEMLNKKFSLEKEWTSVKMYSATDSFPDATRDDVIGCFADKKFFDNLDVFDGFLEVMDKYSDKFNYHIATIGTKSNLTHKKVWCSDNFPFEYNFNGIEKNGTGKDLIDMSGGILIDDHIDNLRSSNASIKILFTGGNETDWNTIDETSEIDKTFWVVENWEDVDDILSFILKIRLLEV